MKLLIALILGVTIHTSQFGKCAPISGIDISSNQPTMNWSQVKSNGISFAYIKATEGCDTPSVVGYKNPYFSDQWLGANNISIIRGAYHYARPDLSTGALQATYFLKNGGGWTADGITLPGAVDLEECDPKYHPCPVNPCYGLTPAAMVSWITDFSNTYHATTSRYPVFYTRANWWNPCTGSNSLFGSKNPLWLASYTSLNLGPGALPAGWSVYSFWQYTDTSCCGGDADIWNGTPAGLKAMALGHT